VTFQRARSEEQREIRRRAILGTAASMLDELPVAEISLNELSRRAGLAKSNVLRYFESREAILLELFEGMLDEWMAALAPRLAADVDPARSPDARAVQLATTFATTLTERRVLCELFSAQAAVLEHNVSADSIAGFKRRSATHAVTLVGLIRQALPELSEEQAWRLIVGALVLASSLWAHANPPQGVLDAYEQIPELRAMRIDFPTALEDSLATMAVGLHARSGRR